MRSAGLWGQTFPYGLASNRPSLSPLTPPRPLPLQIGGEGCDISSPGRIILLFLGLKVEWIR